MAQQIPQPTVIEMKVQTTNPTDKCISKKKLDSHSNVVSQVKFNLWFPFATFILSGFYFSYIFPYSIIANGLNEVLAKVKTEMSTNGRGENEKTVQNVIESLLVPIPEERASCLDDLLSNNQHLYSIFQEFNQKNTNFLETISSIINV